MDIGDTIYYVETSDARLEGQEDGVSLFRGEVFEKDKKLYALTKKLIYFAGKHSYSKKGGTFSSIGVTFQLPFAGKSVFEKLNLAQQNMIEQIFEKRRWMQ